MAQPVDAQPPVNAPGAPPPAPPRRPKSPRDFTIKHDIPVQLWTAWDVTTALGALDQHTQGQFAQSGLLAEAMTQDDAFDAVLNTRVLGLISRPFKLLPSPKGNRTKARIAHREIEERWDDLFPESTVAAILRQALQMGVFVGQSIWTTTEKRWTPDVQPWHPALTYYRIDTRCYVANTQEGPAYVQPGAGQWLLYAPHGAYRGWMMGAVRSISIPWLARQYALRDWARYSEVHGLPVKKAKAPAGAKAEDKAAFEEAIANLGSETVVLLPQGMNGDSALSFDLDLLEAKADTWQAFQGLIDKCEKRMAIRMLGQNLTTDIDAGSLAAANVHDRVRLDYTKADAKTLARFLRKQILEPYCEFNFGDASIAPVPFWDCTPPEDKASTATAMTGVATAIQSLVTVGAPIDIRRTLKKHGFALLPKGEPPPAPPAPAQDTPAEPREGGEDASEEGGAGESPSEKEKAPTARLAAHTAAVLAQLRSNMHGQVFVDEVADQGASAAVSRLRPHVNAIARALADAKDYEDARRKLKAILRDANPARMAKLLENAMLLGHLAGRHSADRGTK